MNFVPRRLFKLPYTSHEYGLRPGAMVQNGVALNGMLA